MADDETPEEEQVIKREIREIIPDDTMPQVNDPEPPEFSVPGAIEVVKKKGLVGAITDDAWGPHVHLLMLISIIFLIAVVIAIIQAAIG